jgi:hypothetical protein
MRFEGREGNAKEGKREGGRKGRKEEAPTFKEALSDMMVSAGSLHTIL